MKTALQLELDALKTAEMLQSDRPAAANRMIFYQFFLPILNDPHRERWLSYGLQFTPWLTVITENLTRCGWDPADLRNLVDIIRCLRDCRPDDEPAILEAESRAQVACALHFLHVGEIERAAEVLGVSLPTVTETTDPAERLLSSLRGRLRDDLQAAVTAARADVGVFRPDAVHALLVAGEGESSTGVLLSLHARAQERPSDAEEDRILLNNSVPLQHGGLLWSLHDALAAAHAYLPESAAAHYSVHFSLQEKEAELVGASLGLAAGALAAAAAANAYFRLPIFTLNQNAALTGAIAPDGRLLPVDEQGLVAKLRAAFFSPLERVFVARQNLPAALRTVAELERRYPGRLLPVHGLEHLKQALDDRNLVRSKPLTPAVRLLSQARRLRRKGLTAAALLLLMTLVYLTAWNPLHWRQDRRPADYDVKGSKLVVKNQADEVLWNYDFGVTLAEGAYLKDQRFNPLVQIADLNNDGKAEVIIGFSEQLNHQLDGRISCFSAAGRLLWTAKPGRALHFGDQLYEDRFVISKLLVLKTRRQPLVVVTGHHRPYFTSFVALYDADGQLKGQYWNAGAITELAVHDLDADGDDEVLCGGYRNLDGRAFLAVLESDNLWGQSPQDSTTHYYSPDLPPGTERRYLRLPPTPFSMPNPWRDYIADLLCLDGNIEFSLCNAKMADRQGLPREWGVITFRYDFQMRQLEWRIADLQALKLRRILGRDLTPAETAALSRTDYWDGEQWVPEPTENRRYKKGR